MRILKDERGAAPIVEAALVYPIVIIVVVFMIYYGMYVYESSVIHDMAGTTAVMASKSVSFPGYEYLGESYVYGDHSDEGEITPDRVKKAYETMKPYRYIFKNEINDRFSDSLIEKSEDMLLKTEDIQCSITSQRHKVTVKLEKKVTMPQLFEFIGLNDSYRIKATSTALISDPAEFVRNTDITANLLGFLSQKLKAGEKFSQFREKIDSVLKNLNIGGE